MKISNRAMLLIVICLGLALVIIANTSGAVAIDAEQEPNTSEVDLAKTTAQSFLISDTLPAISHWDKVEVRDPITYYGLSGTVTAYGFHIEKDGETVGHIIIGSKAYAYPIFELISGTPPPMPNKSQAKPIIEGVIGYEISETAIEGPKKLLYLGVGGQFAVFEIDDQEIAVSLSDKYASLIESLRTNLVSPEEYLARKQANKLVMETQSGTGDVEKSVMTSQSPPQSNCLPQVVFYCKNEKWNCGPEAGVVIAKYWRDWKGFVEFPDDETLYERMCIRMGYNAVPPVFPGEFQNAFDEPDWDTDVPKQFGYDFEIPLDNAGPSDYENNISWVCTLLNRPQDVVYGHGRAEASGFRY